MTIERGDIYSVNLESTTGNEHQGIARPCVVLSSRAYNRQLRTVCVVPLASISIALAPLIVPLPSAGKSNSMALRHQIRTIDKTRIGKLPGTLSLKDLAIVEDGVRRVHGL